MATENGGHSTRYSDSQTSETLPMECPFSEVGCTLQLYTDGAYHDHLTENTEQHLQMVMDLHRRSLSSSVYEYHDPTMVVSPLEKLEAIKTEVEFLECMLENSGITQIPALECIRTQLLLPDILIKKLGDHCTFRMTDYTNLRKNGKKWISPHFMVRGGYNMCLVVYPSGVGSGAGTHLSLSLLLLFDDQLEWPISLPSHVGIRVELLVEAEVGTIDDDDTSSEDNGHMTGLQKLFEITWKPQNKSEHIAKATAKHHLSSSKKRASFFERKTKGPLTTESVRLARIFPPWCQQPPVPSSSVATVSASMNTEHPPSIASERDELQLQDETTTHNQEEESDIIGEGKSSDKVTTEPLSAGQEEEEELGGVTLFTAEQFATHDQVAKYVVEYNSLVFQVTLCLM